MEADEATSKICKVFVPSKCLNGDSGILLGLKAPGAMCVTSVLEIPRSNHWRSLYSRYKQTNHENCTCILGVWDNRVDSIQRNAEVNQCLRFAHDLQLPIVHLRKVNGAPQPQVSSCGALCDKDIVVVIYDIDTLANAVYLTDRSQVKSNLSLITNSFAVYKETRSEMLQWVKSKGLTLREFVSHQVPLASQLQNHVLRLFCWFFMNLSTFLSLLHRCVGSLNGYFVRLLLSLPACLAQVSHRYTEIRQLASRCLPFSKTRDTILRLKLKNAFWRHIVDIILGVAVMLWLTKDGRSALLAESAMTWAQNVASQLQELLHWMMGAPAGLKLNSELAHFLGKFFLYHIYVWTGYLQFLRPFWSDAVWCIALSGCLGLSVQLSLVQDLLSMMTLHIYCFYVYAARLYHLQLSGLSSLWRLFRGKKWNSLRQRVDSVSYGVDQLFVGTLLFTILLFLLPTTLMFYSVFAALRSLVLLAQASCQLAVQIFNALPIYSAFLRVTRPDKLSDDVLLYALQQAPGQPLYLAMQFVPACWTKLWDSSSPSNAAPSNSWRSLGSKLLRGQLIYPWMQHAS